jgi:hypothetical protein
MQYINLTPHAINLNSGESFPPSGQVARVQAGYSEFDEQGICSATFGEVQGLPEPQEGVLFIVSGLVAGAVKGVREDVVAPATGHPLAVREGGQIVSVPGFVRA